MYLQEAITTTTTAMHATSSLQSTQSMPQHHQQRADPAIALLKDYLLSLIYEVRTSQHAEDVELSLLGFCRELQKTMKMQTHKCHLDALLDELEQNGAIRVMLQIIQQHHHQKHYQPDVYKWALAALVWFIHSSNRRATIAIQMGALPIIVLILRVFSDSEVHHRASLSVLTHLLNTADPRLMHYSLIKQQSYWSQHRDDCPPSNYGAFLLEDLITSMERFPHSAILFKQSCSVFGSVYVVLQGSNLLSAHLMNRIIACIYNGFLVHSVADAEIKMVSQSLLKLLMGTQHASTVVGRAEYQLCHGGAA